MTTESNEHEAEHTPALPEASPSRPIPLAVGAQQTPAAPRRLGLSLAVALLSAVAGGGATYLWVTTTHGARAGAPSTEPTPSTATDTATAMPGMDMGGGAKPAGAGNKAVRISPERQQLIGVRTATVTHQALDSTVRTVGTLAYDETRVTEIHTKIAGWIENLSVDYVGKLVQKGQPLFSIYSPDLVSTQREYLLALKARAQLGASQFEDTRAGAASLVDAARERLKLWDVSDAQIAELEQSGEPRRVLTLYSPFSGVVLERNAFAGQYITPEMSTFKIADLSTIWVIGQVFEYEMQNIKLGQQAQIEFPYGQSTRSLTGRITFIYPEIDPQTRRAKVRIEFKNPGLQFKPETYVTVVLKSSGGHQLAIPKEALLDDGSRQYVIVALDNGYFEPREIKAGPPVDTYFPVLSGLEGGERIVTSAQFLVDSETNLQAAMKAMSMSMPGMDMGGGDMKGMDPATSGAGSPQSGSGPAKDPMEGMDMTGSGGDHGRHQQPAAAGHQEHRQ